ncbi:Cell division protein FtsZ, partial [termite gut metagenome]
MTDDIIPFHFPMETLKTIKVVGVG